MSSLKATVIAAAAAAAGAFSLDEVFGSVSSTVGIVPTISNCGSSADKASAVSASVDPPDVTKGQNFTTSISFTLPDGYTATNVTAKYSASLNGLPVYNGDGAICPPFGREACPFSTGSHTVYSDPTAYPDVSGKLVSKIKWIDQAGSEIFCIAMTFQS